MKILIAVEDESSGNGIVDFVIQNMAWRHDSEYIVLHVIPPLSNFVKLALTPELATKLSNNARQEGKLLVRELALRLRSMPHVSAVREVVAEGHRIEEIVSMARQWNTQLLLVGTDDFKGISPCFSCSVAISVLSHSDCSVLVVRNVSLAS
ncbi:MAG: universal stress protein [Candidatus Obscuribacterales bacterium]|nr:universal stress protein [Candidatus Obscuribacterales bacterium]